MDNKTKNKKKIKISAVFRTVMLVFISLILGLTVYSWNAQSLVGNKLPMPFGFGVSVVLSGSMEPVLSVDDLVFIKSADSYKPDDIVVYQSGDALVIHRIIHMDDGTVTTQGDANNIADEPIEIGAVKGKLVGHIPMVGAVVRAIKSPVGIIVLIAAAVLLLELSWHKEKQNDLDELNKIKEEIEKLKNENTQ